jgi:hypothetical protein
MQGDHLTIKVSAASMIQASQLFQRINGMDIGRRKEMFDTRSDIDGDAGWTWMLDYTLVKVAPGLVG